MENDGETVAFPRTIAVRGIVHAAEVDQLLETFLVAQPFADSLVVLHLDGELAQTLDGIQILDRVEKLLQPWRHRAMVLVLLILFWSCTMP
jgi:hypothetical protein